MNKPKLVEVSEPELSVIRASVERLECPFVVTNGDGHWYADADELRAWRSQRQSGDQQ